MSKNKTLIILTPGFPKDESDTSCLPFLQTFTRSLKRTDPSLNIIVLAFQYPFFAKKYKWENLTIISFNGKNKGKIYRILLWIRIWRTIRKLVKEHNVIGFFNLWLGECALVGKQAAKKHGLKSFSWILGQDAKSDNKYVSIMKPEARELIALSDFLASTFANNFKIMPHHVIPLGIDQHTFPAILGERDIDILGAGSLIPLKQYDVFIKLVAKLTQSHPAIKTVILGEGVEHDRLQKMIDENNLNKNIILAGNTDHNKVLTYMQRSKIFLHPSSYEGFAAVFAEALYAGAKLVSFVKPMNQSFKNWYVVDSEEAMLNQLQNLLNDKLALYERVLIYDSNAAAKSVLALYD